MPPSAGLSVSLGPDRAPDRGPAPDDARRAAPLRGAARAARRPAPDPVRGPRDPTPAARGDHAAVADLRPADRGARRRSTRSGRRWRSSTRRCSRSCRGCTASLDGALDPPAGASPASGAATDAGRTGTRPPRVAPFLHWGSWIGGDRDGNPGVTADITERTAADPGRPRPARLRGGRHAADADRGRGDDRRSAWRGRWPRGSRATPRSCPRPIASCAAASRTSRTASGSGSSPSGCAGRGRR